MAFMKRRDAGRVLTFAVTGALLGGVGISGCHHKHRGPYTNPGPELQPPGGSDADGTPSEDPPPDEVTPTNPGPQPEPEPLETVNEGPVVEPPERDEGTNNVRKVEPPPSPKKKS